MIRHATALMLKVVSVSILMIPPPPLATAQTPLPIGSEFQVNTYAPAGQSFPSVAMRPTGEFAVAWESYGQDGPGWGTFGQSFAASGTPVGDEFQASTSGHNFTTLAFTTAGEFVVVAAGFGSGPVEYSLGIFGQRFAANGSMLGSEFLVNTQVTQDQDRPSTDSDSGGNFVVVWQSRNQDGSGQGVFGQRFDPDGLPLDIEFQVNSHTPFDQQRPSVAVAADGDFVVVWESADQDGSGKGIFGQRFGADTSPLGDEFQVNTYTTGSQYSPAVASSANGDFVVVWPDGMQDGSATGIFGQRITADGTPAGVEFQVNTYTTGGQGSPDVASDANGNFFVVWHGTGPAVGSHAWGRAFAGDGTPTGDVFQVDPLGSVGSAAIAVGSTGDFVVTYASLYPEDSIQGHLYMSQLLYRNGLESGDLSGWDSVFPPPGP